jgi:uncharacterized protein (DUF2141 family)
MKNFLILFCMVLSQVGKSQTTVAVRVDNFKNDKGVCRACLFNSAASFNGEGTPMQCVQVLIKNKKANVYFNKVGSGIYAISVFHDANNNSKMDKNFLGIPKEGYGASQNDLPFASAPSFADNKFTVQNKPVSLIIKLRNL